MNGLSPEYREAIEASLRSFVRNGDDVAALGYFVLGGGTCQMCAHSPIKWHYILENLQSHKQLVVGSECIQNYQIILSEWGYRPEYIVAPEFLTPYLRWVLDKNPKAIKFDNNAVLGFQTDCDSIVKSSVEPERLEHFGYLKRALIDGREIVVRTNQLGEETPLRAEDIPF